MKNLGTRDEMDYGDIIRIKEFDKPYQLKIIDGPKQSHSIFYPSLNETGQPMFVMLTVRDRYNNPLTPLADLHKKIVATHIYEKKGRNEESHKEVKAIRTVFFPDSRFHALCLNKFDTVPAVRRVEFPWTIYDSLMRIEQEKFVDKDGNTNEGLLRYGLLFMLWVEMKKVYKFPNKKDKMIEYMNTTYDVRVLENEAKDFIGKIPSSFLKGSISIEDNIIVIKIGADKKKIDPVKLNMFTSEQWAAVLNFEKGIDDFIKPMSDEAIIEKLNKYPLIVNATRDGKEMIPYYEELLTAAKEKSLEYQLEKSNAPLALGEGESKNESKDEDFQDAEEIEVEETKEDDLDDLFGEKKDDEVSSVDDLPF